MITEKELCNFEGKEIKVICSNGRVLSGFCVYFTQALDNEPEIASITVNNHLGFTEIYQNEIETIEIITK